MGELYYTQSLNLAAYFIMHGLELQGFRKNERSTTMYFNKSERLFELLDSYNEDKYLKNFIASFKELKAVINK